MRTTDGPDTRGVRMRLDVGRRDIAGLGTLGIASLMLPAASASASTVDGPTGGSAPDGATEVAWTDGALFDAWTERSGVTSSDRAPTNTISWQLYLAHVDLEIPSGTTDAYGINTYFPGGNTWDWYVSVSSVADAIGSFAAPTRVARDSASYVTGGFYLSNATADLSVPAGHHFLVGVRGGPYYRSFRTIAAPRTAMIGASAQFTALDRVYYGDHGSQTTGAEQLPSQIGGTGTFYTQLDGYAAVISIRPSVA